METIRTALLVSLIVILIVILYRRLLKKAGKKKPSRDYAQILHLETTGELMVITLEIPVKEQVKLSVFNEDDDQLKVLVNEELTAGEHLFEWEKPTISTGKFYCMLESKNQRSTRYFL